MTAWRLAASRRRPRPDRHLGLPLRRRTGGALRRPPRPDMGGAAGTLAAPLRDRARPRPRNRLRLARRQREPLRLRPALFSWEPWHFGFDGRPAPCSDAGNALGPGDDGSLSGRRPALLRPRPLPPAAPARRRPLERLGRPARRPADGRVELQPLRRLPAGARGHRPVHAQHRRLLRPRRPLRPGRGDRRPGPPDVGPDPPVRLARSSPSPPTTPARPRSKPATASPRSPRPRPTSPASSPCSAAPAPSPLPGFEVRLVA